MGALASDDVFLLVVRFVPMLFVVAGVGVVIWLSGQRLPHEIQPYVLAALSETEALPTHAIRQREPLAYQNFDQSTLETVLERLCTDGLAVRWFEDVDNRRQAVYRRVRPASEKVG
jgi:hypothetical protein